MANGTRRRDVKKESFWRRKLDQHEGSGLSVRAWCRKQGLTEAAFYWWRRELARRDAERKPSPRRDAEKHATPFLPVHVTGYRRRDADPQIEVMPTDGRRVRITGPLNRQVLTEVLDALERELLGWKDLGRLAHCYDSMRVQRRWVAASEGRC